MNQRLWYGLVAVGLAVVVVAQTVTAGMTLKVNGKDVPGKTILSGGQTYVPLSALKAAGAVTSVSGKTLSIGWPQGGANQAAAVEGRIGDWLINGVWRFKVHALTPLEGERPGWSVKVELRNATTTDGLSLAGTGFVSLDLVMKDGNKLGPANITDVRDPGVAQAAAINTDLVFFDDDGAGHKPDKLILRIEPDDFTVNYLKGVKVAYSTKNPTFRVQLATE